MNRKRRLILLISLVFFAHMAAASYAECFTLPESLNVIEEAAFAENNSIEEIVLPKGLEKIGNYAFSACTALRYVTIPDSVKSIGEHAFSKSGGPLLLLMPGNSPLIDYALSEGIDFQGGTQYRALLIGQCDYQTMSKLKGPESDIQAMANMLGQYSGTPYNVTVSMNLKGKEICSCIENAFDDAQPQDVSLLYYSGHGGESADPSLNGSLMGVDGQPVTVAALKNCLSKVPGRKIVILDACFSGQSISKSMETETIESKFTQAVINAFSRRPYMKSGNGDTLADDAYYVITAAHSTQTSMEETTVGITYGIFTYALCKGCGYDMLTEAICDEIADADGDSVITIQEAYRYALVTAGKINNKQIAQVWPDSCNEFGFLRLYKKGITE